MKIKFIGKDPRAGMVAQMDSRRGQELIDAGCAVQVKENEGAAEPTRNEGKAAEIREQFAAASEAVDADLTGDEPPAEQPEAPEQPEPQPRGKKGKGA